MQIFINHFVFGRQPALDYSSQKKTIQMKAGENKNMMYYKDLKSSAGLALIICSLLKIFNNIY